MALQIEGETAAIDFAGTGPVVAGNLNANRAIVTAAVMYCLRALLAEEIPLNQGVLAPVRIVLPDCLLNPPEGRTPPKSPAIVGGNVETSQRVVDVLLGRIATGGGQPGNDEQRALRRRNVRLLRDDLRRRRRNGRLLPGPTPCIRT